MNSPERIHLADSGKPVVLHRYALTQPSPRGRGQSDSLDLIHAAALPTVLRDWRATPESDTRPKLTPAAARTRPQTRARPEPELHKESFASLALPGKRR